MAWWLMAVMPTRRPAQIEAVDDVRAPVRLAGPRRALDRHAAPVELRGPAAHLLQVVAEPASGRAAARGERRVVPAEQARATPDWGARTQGRSRTAPASRRALRAWVLAAPSRCGRRPRASRRAPARDRSRGARPPVRLIDLADAGVPRRPVGRAIQDGRFPTARVVARDRLFGPAGTGLPGA